MQRIEPGLVVSAQRGDRKSLETLWRRSRRYAAAILIAHRPRGADTEDLLQEVALAVVQNLFELRDPAAYLGWLRTIAIRTCQRAGRRLGRDRVARPSDARSLADTEDPNPQSDRQIEVDRTRHAIEMVDTLPEEQREALILRALAGWSQRQIADSLGVPETTVESRLARARRTLRERFEGNATLEIGALRSSGRTAPNRPGPHERRSQ